MNDISELAQALNKFQAELVTVGKSADNPFFKSKYAPLDEIMKAAQPVLTKHDLSVVQLPSHIDGQPALTTIVMHTSGQKVESTAPLLLAKDDPQGQGSAITYMRRYAYAAALGIVIDEDDDGNKASGNRQGFTASATAPTAGLGKNASVLPASPKQKAFIWKLLAERGISEEDAKGYLIEQLGITEPENMTVEQASFAIDELTAK